MSGTILDTYYHVSFMFWCSLFGKTIICVNCSERYSLRALIIQAWVNSINLKCFVQWRQRLVCLRIWELWAFPVVTWLSALCWSKARRGRECFKHVCLVWKVLNSNLMPDGPLWNIVWRMCSSTQRQHERESIVLFKVGKK